MYQCLEVQDLNERSQIHFSFSGANWRAHSVGEKREAIPFVKLRSVVEKFDASRVPLTRDRTEPLKCDLEKRGIGITPIIKNEFGDVY